MEHDFLGRFSGKFPGARERLKRQSCFSWRNVPNEDSCSTSSKPSLIPVRPRFSRPYCGDAMRFRDEIYVPVLNGLLHLISALPPPPPRGGGGGGGGRIVNAIAQFCSLPKPWTNQLARVNINSKQPGFPTCGCFWKGSRQAAKTKALILCHYFLFVCLLTFSSSWKMLKMLQQEHIPEEHEVKCQTTRSLESTLKNHQIGSVTRRENPVETLKNLRYGSDEKNNKVVIKDINHRR